MTTPRRLRMALHAFPRRFRAARSAEIEATFHEADQAGEPNPYGQRALIDVVVAGWSERVRTHPTAGVYLKYRLLGGRLDPRWHAWMLDDIRGWYWLRRLLITASPLLAMWVYLWVRFGVGPLDAQWQWMVLVASLWVVFGILGARRDRKRILRLHGYDTATREWLPPGRMSLVLPPRLTKVSPVAFMAAAALALVAPFAVLASAGLIGSGADDSRRADGQLALTLVSVAGALVFGAVGVMLGPTIVRRLTTEVDQPADLDLVFSDLPAAGGLSAAIAALGVIACLYPVTPLIVPLLLVVASGAIPVLVLAGIDARACQHDDAVVVWSRRSIRSSSVHRR